MKILIIFTFTIYLAFGEQVIETPKNLDLHIAKTHTIIKRSPAGNTNKLDFDHAITVLKAFVNFSCAVNGGDADAFWTSFNKANLCFKEKEDTYKFLETPQNVYKEYIHNCSKDMIEKSKTCLSEHERYFPIVTQQATDLGVDLVYQHQQELFKEKPEDLVNCGKEFKTPEVKRKIYLCYGSAYFDAEGDPCSKFKDMKNCINTELQQLCSKDNAFVQILMEWFEGTSELLCAEAKKKNKN